MDTVDLFTMGEALAVLWADDGAPLERAVRFHRSVAGSEVNVAVAMSRLGHSVRYVARVGDDFMGAFVRDQLADTGVDVRLATDAGAATGIYLRDMGVSGSVHAQYARAGSAGSRLTVTDVDRAWEAGCRALFVTGLTAVLSDSAEGAVIATAVRARAEGAIVVLDPNIRPALATAPHYQRVCLALIELADIVIAGEDELCLVTGRDGVSAARARVLDGPTQLVVGKRGPGGSWATDGALLWDQSAVPVEVVDPVGAGDAFAAAFISGRLGGLDVPACLEQAAWVASRVVTTAGDLEGLPTRGDLQGRASLSARTP